MIILAVLKLLLSFQREGNTLAYVDSFACARIVGTDTVVILQAYRAETPSSWSFCSQTGTIDSATLYGIDPQFVDPANGDFTYRLVMRYLNNGT